MWMRDWIYTWGMEVNLLDRTMSLAAINVTGPRAGELLGRLGVADAPRFLQHLRAEVAGVPCHVMRLSFTGEASFELHHPVDRSVELWRALMSGGNDFGIRPHGLQALFALRLEKGHVIIGLDTELDTTPRRLGMDWAVNMDKPDFIGRDALARTASLPDPRRLVGLTMDGVAPTDGSPISSSGDVIGHVTSSFASPVLGHSVMLGWLKRAPFPEQVEIGGAAARVRSGDGSRGADRAGLAQGRRVGAVRVAGVRSGSHGRASSDHETCARARMLIPSITDTTARRAGRRSRGPGRESEAGAAS